MKNKALHDGTGSRVSGRMRGVNLGGWFSQIDCIQDKNPKAFPGLDEHLASFIAKDDMDRIVSMELDHVRLPVDWTTLFSVDGSMTPKAGAFEYLDDAIQMISDAGLGIILDLHKCPGHDFYAGISAEQPFFADPDLRRDAKKVWSVLCERYGHKTNITFELLNEPTASDSAVWNTVKDELFAHIRKAAPHRTILVGSNRWNSAGEFKNLTPLEDGNVIYSFHFYNPLVFTHQKASWMVGDVFFADYPYPGTYPDPWSESRLNIDSGFWDSKRLEKEIEPVLEFREKYGVPVACNEFGVYVGGADRRSQLLWMRDFLGVLERNDIGFSYWNYKNLDFGLVSRGEMIQSALPQYVDDPDGFDRALASLLREF